MIIKTEANVIDSFYCGSCKHIMQEKPNGTAPFCTLFNVHLCQSKWDHYITKCRKCVDACYLAAVNK